MANSTDNLGDVLYAFVARLTPNDLRVLVGLEQDWRYASMNQGIGARLKRMQETQAACDLIVHNMTDHDKALVLKAITEVKCRA